MAQWCQWEVYCIDEGKMVQFWAPASPFPTACPNHSDHKIDEAQTRSYYGCLPNHTAYDCFHLNDGNDVWKVTVDSSGNLQTTKVT